MLQLFSTPTFRSVASQIFGSFPYYCLVLAFGSTQGFQITLIAEMYKSDSEIFMTVDQLSWFAGLDIISPLIIPINGISTQRFGSRVVTLVSTMCFISLWLLYHYSTSATVILIVRVLSIIPATTEIALPHISEISEPRFRTALLVFCSIGSGLGSFFSLLLANFFHWRTVALINLVFPIMGTISALFTPSSPAWLASKGRLDEAEKALCWLRGWVDSSEVQIEFLALADTVQKSKSSSDVEAASWQERSKQFFRLFFERSFYLPLGTICLMFIVWVLSGVPATDSYSAIVFDKLNSPIKPSIATVILGAASIVGKLILLLSVSRIGKRKLIFFSVVVIGLCYAIVAVIGFLKLQGDYLWISPIAVIIANLADASGIGPIPFMLSSEIFPSSVRYIGTSITFSFYLVCTSLMNKSYLYILNAITLPGVFVLFAAGNLIALVTYYFVVPETEGKSLEEIEDHYRSDKKLDETKDSNKIVEATTSYLTHTINFTSN